MTTQRPAIVTLLLLLAGAAGCAEPPVTPGYEKDVKPIFQARCLRCHAVPRPDIPVQPGLEQLFLSFRLDIYENDPITGTLGARSMAGPVKHATVDLGFDDPLRMPPKPSLPLSELQKDTLSNWAANPLP